MRRRRSLSVINLCVFAVLLLLILYLGRSQSSSKTLAWTTVRYQTTANKPPEARGRCPGIESSGKPALVVSRVAADGDPKWVDQLAGLYHICIYTADAQLDDASTFLQVPANRGHEAMAYLTFIIDNYKNIPEAGAVFIHGTRWSWHNDHPEYDNLSLLKSLNVSAATSQAGYHNLRCDWSVGTCMPDSGHPQGSLASSAQAIMEPYNLRAVSNAALPGALASIFGGEEKSAEASLGRAATVRTQCCAQFAVARDSIWQHPWPEYVAIRQWLLDGRTDQAAWTPGQDSATAPPDDRVAGRILSYVWHILFMQREKTQKALDLTWLNAAACPSAEECYCRLYGRCRLKDCTSDACRGQYRVPTNFKLPENWAATHS